MCGDVARHGHLAALPRKPRCGVILIARDDGVEHIVHVEQFARRNVGIEVDHRLRTCFHPVGEHAVRNEEYVMYSPCGKVIGIRRFIVADDVERNVDRWITLVEALQQYVENSALLARAVRIPVGHREGNGVARVLIDRTLCVIFRLDDVDLILRHFYSARIVINVPRAACGKRADRHDRRKRCTAKQFPSFFHN